MGFWADVKRGDKVQHSALLENNVRHMVNALNGFGSGAVRATGSGVVRVAIWNAHTVALQAGQPVMFDAAKAMCGDALPAVPCTDASKPYGVCTGYLAPNAMGDCVLAGAVPVTVTGGTGSYAIPDATGAGFVLGDTGQPVLFDNLPQGAAGDALVHIGSMESAPIVPIYNLVEKIGGLTVRINNPFVAESNMVTITFPSTAAAYYVAYFRPTERQLTEGLDQKPDADPNELYAYFVANETVPGNINRINFNLIHGVYMQVLARVVIAGGKISQIVQYSYGPELLRTRKVDSFYFPDIFPVYDSWNSTPRLVTPADFYCTKFRIRGAFGALTPRWGGTSVWEHEDHVFNYSSTSANRVIYYHSNRYFTEGPGHSGGYAYDEDIEDFEIPVASYTVTNNMISQLYMFYAFPFMLNPDVFNN